MESYYLDWANLLLRWTHVITAIAWIGSSFYFVFLDNSLTPPVDEDLKKQGVSGEMWAMHGGGFYHPVKFAVSPPVLPPGLHFFFWPSYTTWLSGMVLFGVSYLWNAKTYLIDPRVMDWQPATAGAVALAFLAVFWLLYDQICRHIGRRKHGDAWVGALVLLLVCAASWLACHWFAGRAAFLLVGAMLATAMSANVFVWIIPGQRKTVAALRAGQPVDPIHGLLGKQRSVHNTYFTLPVLLAMLSNHYSFTYLHPQNWLVLIALMLAGAAIRQFFVLRHGYLMGRRAYPLAYALAGVGMVVALIVWMAPRPASGDATENTALTQAQTSGPSHFGYPTLQPVLARHCYGCHGPQVQMKNVRLDSPDQVRLHAQTLYQQAVVTRIMPMGNATGMTDTERRVIKQWFEAGAQVE